MAVDFLLVIFLFGPILVYSQKRVCLWLDKWQKQMLVLGVQVNAKRHCVFPCSTVTEPRDVSADSGVVRYAIDKFWPTLSAPCGRAIVFALFAAFFALSCFAGAGITVSINTRSFLPDNSPIMRSFQFQGMFGPLRVPFLSFSSSCAHGAWKHRFANDVLQINILLASPGS